ncbi:undecaprenyl-diphosphatase UppP [Desulfuribacillus alkaliarsenatis]|uniref:Undecaprenyl-diphosphatase n=1 Tax=Desulfuribacillus alkaliarsenatis TaxID=766136 RepID=A0A1E5G3U1_9FIRM|nr:undecaprenyl-diphosphatase UppP [Desulfuribacillus alkaliarsenatis]OEF97750.1 undecaprenyl-diphosphatase UppP [Desulfuribacillus alkaliarsenatis]
MNWFEALVLGIVQGITEFLPISSSAHLIITQELFGISMPGLAFEVFLHFASLLAVVYFFRADLAVIIKEFLQYVGTRNVKYKTSFWFGIYIIAATFITGVLGILLEKQLADTLRSMTTISIALFFTGLFLILIERVMKYGNRREKDMTFWDAFWVGIGQTVAVIPGVSRAGSTLVAALWVGLDKSTAVRFSFLLSIPVILGSTVLMFPDMRLAEFDTGWFELTISFIASFIFALIGIRWLIAFLNRSKLIYFAYYCFFVSGVVFIFLR